MPRLSNNPMKGSSDFRQPEKITVTSVVYIPYLEGYWEQALPVLKVCFNSLRRSTAIPFDLMVFDNGSAPEVRDYLTEASESGLIQYLILSEHNIGKVGAWNAMFGAAQGEYVAFMDSDVLFLPGWLEESLRLLEAFPKAGTVTAQPVREIPEYFATMNAAALRDAPAEPDIRVEHGAFVPPHYHTALRLGLGDTVEKYTTIRRQEDVRLTRGDASAYIAGSHFQFLTRKSLLREIFPLPVTTPVGSVDEPKFDRGVNEQGGWRLSTVDYFVHHMGNRLPTAETDFDGLSWLDTAALLAAAGAEADVNAPAAPTVENPLVRAALKRSFVRRALRYLHRTTHRLLLEQR